MQITIDGEDFLLEEKKLTRDAGAVVDVAQTHVRTQAFRTKGRVQREMPVDTGRARASWGAIVPMNWNSEMDDGVWEFKDNGLTNIQGSRVPYIGPLNEGHSMQAPAGFIDAAAADAGRQLADDLMKALVHWWGSQL